MKKIVLLMAMFFLFGVNAYAANGDLIVNGSLGVGTSTPAEKAEINGNMVVNGTLSVGSGGVKYPDGSIQTSATKLIWEYTVTDLAVTSVTSPTLDGNTDGGYFLEAYIVNGTASPATVRLYYNNDTVGTNYRSVFVYSGPPGPLTSNLNDASFLNMPASGHWHLSGDITLTPNLLVMTSFQCLRSDNIVAAGYQRKLDAVNANLTRIDIVASVTNSIGVKSRFRLWKRL